MELAPRTREAEGGIAAAYAEGLRLLHDEVARKTVCRFDKDQSNAIAQDRVKHAFKAGAYPPAECAAYLKNAGYA